jgi:glucan biosynthesis protein C
MTQVIDSRRYDIDWLRTLAFGLLILYHVGMYYVADWGWHIKSTEQSVWLQDLMILTNQWRMSLLFFISGMALALVCSKFSLWQLTKIRSQRLLVPLIFGMLVIVPPQLYFELLAQQQFSGSYLAFMQEYLNLDTSLAPHKQSAIGLLTWNHLWFLPYLWCYSLIMLLLYPLLKKLLHFPVLQKLPLWLGFMMLVVALVFIGLWLQDYPSTHALTDDWFLHGLYFTVFISGMALPNLPQLWQQIIAKRRWFAILALSGYCWLVLDRHGMLDIGEELDGLVVIKLIHAMLLSINHWAWIFALLAYAGRYLQFNNAFLRYANQAILPWYMFHQTLIILFAISLKDLNIPAPIEAPILILLTSLGCLLGYEVARRSRLSRWLFGLKPDSKLNKKSQLAQKASLQVS